MRIDKILIERKLAPERQKAQALIMSGCVLVDDVPVTKAGQLVDPSASIRIKGVDHPFVSRGGVKLSHAIEKFACDVADRVCMDVGASTGGFTDCLLQNGAARVYAIDVGYGQLAMKLAQDERVVVIERTNIRRIDPGIVPEPIDIAVVDVSFISLSLVLPVIDGFLSRGASVIALVKPQFEVEKGAVGEGGIVSDSNLHEQCIEKIGAVGTRLGWRFAEVVESPLRGAKGNKEFLVYFLKE